ncbi:hypothetical protein JCM33374_g1647 [Metschnikowia sp. JCM 33374]|nr:hypothetical protein JCM33374_g1647 [Metschnikowia sp. JCM 33374]
MNDNRSKTRNRKQKHIQEYSPHTAAAVKNPFIYVKGFSDPGICNSTHFGTKSPPDVPTVVYYSQSGYQSWENESYAYLSERGIKRDIPGSGLPPYNNMSAINHVNRPNDHVVKPYMTSQVGPFLPENPTIHHQPFYPNPSSVEFSVTPIAYSATSRLSRLAQDISKAPMNTTHRSSLPNNELYPPVPQISHAFPNFHAPAAPPYGQNMPREQKPYKKADFPYDTIESTGNLKALLMDDKLPREIKEAFSRVVFMLNKRSSKDLAGAPHIKLLGDVGISNTVDFGPGRRKSGEIELLHLVIMMLRTPQATKEVLPGIAINKSLYSSHRVRDLLQTFLAIKIICNAVKNVENSLLGTTSLSRDAVYKVYYIICQKLIRKHACIAKHEGLEKISILGNSRLGKLTKLIFPRIRTKRLGRRGNSKAHYIGLTLDYSMLDSETQHLLHLNLSELKTHFTGGPREVLEDQSERLAEEPQVTMGSAAVDTMARRSFPPTVPTFQEPVPKYQEPWGTALENNLFGPKWNQKAKVVPEQSLGPSIIWKKPLTP